ncbi:50S ribosomal protein L7ae-like protein [Cohnella sp. CFH 77786]|uniref:ribosomal L7Ae/L30e/S12e/Gadd45 family protein n=1 Tax=Cohnella sp. CFH 77786 TaxID=2662265 RepID=UPI001C60ECF1|nr:ribosomal L7Ae/L30e/S12e/Gadd45 family protein [Cohnella sp. CFH 77786]MBW5449182.1 50S ribosomal protein L7ae-like protein [Cohnella sp. CFH 77786]
MTASEVGFSAEGNVVIGTKQTTKAVEGGIAVEVFVAQDADPRMVTRIVQLCEQRGVKLTQVDTMRNLGKKCGIDVGAAMAALVVDSVDCSDMRPTVVEE